jgi:hypothetical protein
MAINNSDMPHEIENVIAGVRRLIPEIEVVQMHKTHEADDDGLWWFKIPGVKEDIQIESSNYNCPFLVEHDSMKSSSDAITCRSIDETVSAIVSYLQPRRKSNS